MVQGRLHSLGKLRHRMLWYCVLKSEPLSYSPCPYVARSATYKKLMPTPTERPLRTCSPLLTTRGRLKFSSNLATGCA